ncbi:hypothetical protein WA171_004052 [Blastocystis sp. BT1]
MEEELRQRRPVTDEVLSDGRDEDEIDSVEQPTTQPTVEKKKTSILTRIVSGLSLLFGFILVVYMGHFPVFLLITAIQFGLFYELLGVRYKEAVEKEIPNFRTVHWLIFLTALFIVFGEDASAGMMRYIPQVEIIVRYHSLISVILYCLDFIFIVLSLKKGYLKYQIGQIAWTMLIIIIVVFQIRLVFPVIQDGLIWFVLPVMTVAWNDTMAYFCGMLWGHKFIKKPLTSLSPNKSWEGFIGGGLCTIIIGWAMAYLFKIPHLYCPFNQPSCPLPSYYIPKFYAFPDWLVAIVNIPGVTVEPIYIHEFFMALFASIVAPFGGFFASAIKRAYGKKDFTSLIPGHGGLMDRFDCQFLMLYFTGVYYATFIREKTVSVVDVLKMISGLTVDDKEIVLKALQESVALKL